MLRPTNLYISVDVEADGPIPGEYSMIWFGAVVIEPELNRTFEGKVKPISDKYDAESLGVSGLTRIQTLQFDEPEKVMKEFSKWVVLCLNEKQRPIFIADNNGFDWMFICYYLWKYTGSNPFGFSSGNINWLYKGVTKNFHKSFKHLRTTTHDHNPVNDAKGNAEAFMKIVNDNGLRM
jgi:hypothetical protein